jgi:SOS response regulatory protein OraA/RecX
MQNQEDVSQSNISDRDKIKKILKKKVLNKAMFFLARREHSKEELKTKLNTFGSKMFSNQYFLDILEDESIEIFAKECFDFCVLEVLEELEDSNLQSDTRFCEIIVRQKHTIGKGIGFIKSFLKKHNIDSEIVSQEIENISGFSTQQKLAMQEINKKFWQEKEFDNKQEKYKYQAKKARFLQQRGFSFDVIQSVVFDQ